MLEPNLGRVALAIRIAVMASCSLEEVVIASSLMRVARSLDSGMGVGIRWPRG